MPKQSERGFLYRIFRAPAIYRVAQKVLAPGARKATDRLMADIAPDRFPPGALLIDVGCGPESRLARHAGRAVLGIDVSLTAIRGVAEAGSLAVVGDSTRIPCRNDAAQEVWCFGLIHHLSDAAARATIEELLRICDPYGRVIVFDAVLPRKPLLRPLAYLLRRLDRGRFVRDEGALRVLFPEGQWSISRHAYTVTGLELVVARSEVAAR